MTGLLYDKKIPLSKREVLEDCCEASNNVWIGVLGN